MVGWGVGGFLSLGIFFLLVKFVGFRVTLSLVRLL